MTLKKEKTNELLSKLKLLNEYSLQDIESLLGYKPGGARNKGVLSIKNESTYLLIINLEKYNYATQYIDQRIDDLLFWEGQQKIRAVENCLHDFNSDILIFLNNKLNKQTKVNLYTYFGRALPIRTVIKEVGTPCQTVFQLYEYSESEKKQSTNIKDYPITSYKKYQDDFDILQTLALQVWDNKCSLFNYNLSTNLTNTSRIKPISFCKEEEVFDGFNSIILPPTIDKVFNLGLVSFNPKSGRIQISQELSKVEQTYLQIDSSSILRKIPSETEKYLKFHYNNIFNSNCSRSTLESELIINANW